MKPRQSETKSPNIEFEIYASNIGPHINLHERFKTNSSELYLFANNGSGKTFLSRIFRLAASKNLAKIDSNKLLTLDEIKGNFSFVVTDISKGKNELKSSLEISLQRDCIPLVICKGNYIYHVFNDDYVKENLEQFNYKPDSNINGYIISKEKIDISKEKINQENFIYDLTDSYNSIDTEINKAKVELKNLGISERVSEFSSLNITTLLENGLSFPETDSYEELKAKQFALNSISDTLPDLQNCSLSVNLNTIFSIQDYLEIPITKSGVAQSFKDKIRANGLFIEEGLKLLSNNSAICPFCEQHLQENALKLIDLYNEFIVDIENQKIKEGNALIRYLESLKTDINNLHNDFLQLNKDYQKYKKWIPSVDNDLLDIDTNNNVNKIINKVINLIKTKTQDISISYKALDFEYLLDNIKETIIEYTRIINTNKSLIDQINNKKNNIKKEKLELSRRIIKAKYNSLRQSLSKISKKCYDLRIYIDLLGEDISIKEASERIDKKTKVIECFRYYLNTFFQGKYLFDENSFALTYKNNILNTNANNVLSEGEKTIVSFCYYLADIHKIVENIDDYDDLFLIVDDPISSLDFHYVYAIAQTIKNFTSVFPATRSRHLILTHNFEFMSVLLRNNLSLENFTLSGGKIKPLRKMLVMPYEQHLSDVYNVAKGNLDPSHTIPNSIRHILETINRFTAPDKPFLDFYTLDATLNDCRFLYTLMHDNSHGNIRTQISYTDDMLIGGCQTVINFIERNFSGQLIGLK